MHTHTCTCTNLSSQCRQQAVHSPFIPRVAVLAIGIHPSPPGTALHSSAKPRWVFLLAETSASKQVFSSSFYIYSVSQILFTQILFLTFPFLTGPSLQAFPNFHKERNCFQVGIKQTRSLEKIKNNEFLSERLLARLSLPLPLFFSLQKKKNKSLLIPLEHCIQICL